MSFKASTSKRQRGMDDDGSASAPDPPNRDCKRKKKSEQLPDSEDPGIETHGKVDTAGSSSTGSTSARKAMMIDLVLQKISKNLSIIDIQAQRQTCKLWNSAFIPEFRRKHAPVKLCSSPSPETETSFPGMRMMESFTDQMRSAPAGFPLTKFWISDVTAVRYNIFKNFISICGKSIKSLSTTATRNSNSEWTVKEVNVDKIRQLVFQLLPELTDLTLEPNSEQTSVLYKRNKPVLKQLPNLRRLTMKPYGEIDQPHRDLLADILKNSVQLEYICVNQPSPSIEANDPLHCMAWDQNIFTTVRDNLAHPERLKTVKLYHLELTDLQSLLELANRPQNTLRLEEFVVSIGQNERQQTDPDLEALTKVFHTFFETQSATLLKFTVEWPGFDELEDVFSLRIPRMEALRVLKIYQSQYWPTFHVEYDGETLGGTCPSLEKLALIPYGFAMSRANFLRLEDEDVEQFEPDEVAKLAHTGVTDFQVELDPDNEILPEISTLLPSVTRLKLEISRNDLGSYLWTLWPNLTVFHLDLKDDGPTSIADLDAFFSGIAHSHRLNQELQDGDVTLERVQQLCRKHKTKSGISDLTGLQEFVLEFDRYRYSLTDIGGFFGFAMANPGLQRLVVKDSKEKERNGRRILSDKCCEFIKSAFSPYAEINLNL